MVSSCCPSTSSWVSWERRLFWACCWLEMARSYWYCVFIKDESTGTLCFTDEDEMVMNLCCLFLAKDHPSVMPVCLPGFGWGSLHISLHVIDCPVTPEGIFSCYPCVYQWESRNMDLLGRLPKVWQVKRGMQKLLHGCAFGACTYVHVCLCAHVCKCAYHDICLEVRGQLTGMGSFLPSCSHDGTQVVSLGSKCVYLLSLHSPCPPIGHFSLWYMLPLKNLFPKPQLLGLLNKEDQTFALFLLYLRSFILTFETTV